MRGRSYFAFYSLIIARPRDIVNRRYSRNLGKLDSRLLRKLLADRNRPLKIIDGLENLAYIAGPTLRLTAGSKPCPFSDTGSKYRNFVATDCDSAACSFPSSQRWFARFAWGGYSIALRSVSSDFGWKYVVGGYAKGSAAFNGFKGQPLLQDGRSTFLFRTFGTR
jgi:hypothetical protein